MSKKHKQRIRDARTIIKMQPGMPGNDDFIGTLTRALRGALSNTEAGGINKYNARMKREAELASADPHERCVDCGNDTLGGLIDQIITPPAADAIDLGLADAFDRARANGDVTAFGDFADDFVKRLRAADKRLAELDEPLVGGPLAAPESIAIKIEVISTAVNEHGELFPTKRHSECRTEEVTPSCDFFEDGDTRSGLCYECPARTVCPGDDEVPF